jgi:hypothetical protein
MIKECIFALRAACSLACTNQTLVLEPSQDRGNSKTWSIPKHKWQALQRKWMTTASMGSGGNCEQQATISLANPMLPCWNSDFEFALLVFGWRER